MFLVFQATSKGERYLSVDCAFCNRVSAACGSCLQLELQLYNIFTISLSVKPPIRPPVPTPTVRPGI